MPHIGTLMLRTIGPYERKRFYAACRQPEQSQRRLLSNIVRRNAETEFGRRFGFDGITSLEEFQSRVPVSAYEDLLPYIEAATEGKPNQLTKQKPVMFTTTSGTTGASKHIPMTETGRRAKSRLMALWLFGLFRDHPKITSGRIMSVVSPEVESYTKSGIPLGSESGHRYRNLPRPVRWMYSSPYEVFTLKDYEAKYYTLLRIAAGQDITCLVTPNPSTIALLGDRLAQHTESIVRDVRDGSLSKEFEVPASVRSALRLRPNRSRSRILENAAARGDGYLRPGHVWPNVAAIGCWTGGTVGSYLASFDTHFPQHPPVRDLGYLATEVSGSVPLSDDTDAGVLAIGTSVFEFRPEDDDAASLLPVERLEVGCRYFIFVTTPSGLYRYDMNDIIEVAGTFERTPLIRFVQKGKGVVSFTGEKLYETQVITAVEEALDDRRGKYNFIAAVAEFPEGADRPRLMFLIEFEETVAERDGAVLVERIDDRLGKQNSEYQAKRESHRYGAPIIRVVRRGEFDAYRRRMVERGRSDGQFKVLRLTSDSSFADEFRTKGEFIADAHPAMT